MLNPYEINLFGSTRTWYSLVVPPNVDTSTIFGTDLNCFSSVQSSIDFSSIKSYFGFELRSVYQKICPTGLQSAPICGCKPAGSVTCDSRSKTFDRFQSFSDSSSKISITLDNPNNDADRKCCKCGIPFICTSMGMVTCCSTSSAARPGHCVMICT